MENGWWSERELAPDSGLRWTLGPLELSLWRTDYEWQLAYNVADEDAADPACAVSEAATIPETADVIERYARERRDRVRCLPVVADRALVVRPRLPVFVPPGEQIRFFVSAPVWIRILVGQPWLTLREVPVKRLSDTWFGASTRDGELAYSLKTHARVHLEEIPPRGYRAITPVLIRNEAEELLSVDRLSLPVPYLSLYLAASGMLWTEAVTMRHAAGNEMATLDVGGRAPAEAGEGALRLTSARLEADRNLLVRAFTNLIDSFRGESDR